MAWLNDGKYSASALGAGDTTEKVWDATPGNLRADYKAHYFHLNSIAWSPDGNYIVSGSNDGTVRVREAATGNVSAEYKTTGNYVYSVAWSPDGNYIVSRTAYGYLQVWEVVTGKLRAECEGYSTYTYVYSVAWSPDGNYILSGRDRTARVGECATGKPITSFNGHPYWVSA